MPRIPATERRNDFVRAAMRVIATHGVEGATTRRIAGEANAPLASLHYVFSTKELLFAAVYDEITRNYLDVLAATPVRKGAVTATACDVLRRAAMWYLQDPDSPAAATELILWARREQGDSAIKLYDTTAAAIVDLLRDATGGDSADEDWLARIAYTVAVLADGFAVNLLTYGDQVAALAQVDVVVGVLEAWLSARKPVADSAVAPASGTPQGRGLGAFASWAP